MANIAQTVNVLQAMILTDPDTGALVLTPTYHVFAMNTGHHDADALAVHLRDVPTRAVEGAADLPLVSASASVKDDTALVSLSNLDADAGPHPRPRPARPRRRRPHRARADGTHARRAQHPRAAPTPWRRPSHAGVRPHPRGPGGRPAGALLRHRRARARLMPAGADARPVSPRGRSDALACAASRSRARPSGASSGPRRTPAGTAGSGSR